MKRKIKRKKKLTPSQLYRHVKAHLMYAHGDSPARIKAQRKIKAILQKLDKNRET
jgi:hypothetical protein